MNRTVALAGQPNTGKSTIFNYLTGARQKVGNWPGKTIEQKSGHYSHHGTQYRVIDLPGTYSLSANSTEEMITRDYILTKQPDLLLVIVDASQLERSLFLLSEMLGLKVPVVVALNMMDVAGQKGIQIDLDSFQERLGVPCVKMTASLKKGFKTLVHTLEQAFNNPSFLKSESYFRFCQHRFGEKYNTLSQSLPREKKAVYSHDWKVMKCIENDPVVLNELTRHPRAELPETAVGRDQAMVKTAGSKFHWIRSILSEAVTRHQQNEEFKRNWFDRVSTHPVLGKPMAVLMLLSGLICSMLVAMPLMEVLMSYVLPYANSLLLQLLEGAGVWEWIQSLASEAVIPAVIMSLITVIFVSGILLVFGFMEDIGYLARVAYVFDHTMVRIGLQGKAIIPMITSFGCNIAGVTGSRVIDSQKQRMLAIAVSLAIPCMGLWGVVSFMSTVFFGAQGILVIGLLFVLTLLHMKVSAWFFSTHILKTREEHAGLIMELPPFHKPNWSTIFNYILHNIKHIAKKAFFIITGVSILVWVLSYSSDGIVEHSPIYFIGGILDPLARLFGLDWRLFIAFIISGMGKEAALGVIAMLYGAAAGGSSFSSGMISGALQANTTALTASITESVSQASALAFIVAFYFNVPCMAAVAAVGIETKSSLYTIKIVAYYVVKSLLLGAAVYYMVNPFLG